MRLPEGIVIDNEETFGVCKFAGLKHVRMVEDLEGKLTDEVKERTYVLKCRLQGGPINVGIPADVPEKTFPVNAEVVLVNPVVDTVANARGTRGDANWYVKADDIVLKTQQPQQNRPTGKPDRPADGGDKKPGQQG